VLPDKLFIKAMTTVTSPHQWKQDDKQLEPWIGKYKLQKIHTTWYKEGRWVVTRTLGEKRSLIEAHHDPPIYGHPGRA
jgi:hypothetical protein